jgi:hypothetical protein
MTHTRLYDDHTVVVPGRVPAYEPRPGGGFRLDWSTNFDMVGPGGLMSSVEDLLLWDRNFYNNKLGRGTLLRELQTPGVLNDGKQIEYALGLGISTYRGLPIVAHGGGLFGYVSNLVRFPQQKLSIICVCNLGTSNPGLLSSKVADLYLEGQFPTEQHAVPASHEDPQPFAGLYRNSESHSVLEVSVNAGDLVAFGIHYKSLGSGHFAGAEWEPSISFQSENSQAMRLTLRVTDTPQQVLERFKPVNPSAEDLAQYVGEYTSNELEATYRFTVKEGKLRLAINWQDPAVLVPTVRDEFQGPFGTSTVFRRDAGGNITGCDVFAGRVRNMTFARTTK